MTASVAIPSHYSLADIAAQAGNSAPEGRWYRDGVLHVDGVEQAALDAAVAEYDHAAKQNSQLQTRLTEALNLHLNAVAGQRRYDDRFTCSLRAGYAGPFQAEGQAFAAWMDACNMAAYSLMAEVKLGLRPVPTATELIAAMPAIEWPPSPIPVDALSLAAAQAEDEAMAQESAQ